MKILRAFQVINRDGEFSVGIRFHEVDEKGTIIKPDQSESFFAVDAELKNHIEAVENYIRQNRLK